MEPIKRSDTLGNAVFDQLRAALMDGAFKPGERITVRGLAETTGVSSTPAREALGRLVASGALQLDSDRTVQVPQLSEKRVQEIYAIRRNLEGMLVSISANVIPVREIDRLSGVLTKREAALDAKDFRRSLSLNREFAFGVYTAAQMPTAIMLVETLWSRIGPTLNLLYPHFAETRSGIAMHRALIAAMRGRDSKAAQRVFDDDLREAERVIVTMLNERRFAA